MKQDFKVDFKNQYLSLQRFLYAVLFLAVVLIVWQIFDQDYVETKLLAFLFFTVIYGIGVLPIHIQYLIKNWKTKFTVDFSQKKIIIIEGSKITELEFSEILTERIISNQTNFPNLLGNYGYVKIKAKDQIFIITSLMVNPSRFPIKIDKTKKCLPFIGS